jgi:hypothetical protein
VQQLAEHHGITDIRDKKLIQAQKCDVLSNFAAHLHERVSLALRQFQTLMEFQHESVKMDPSFPLARHSVKKDIRHHRFPTAYAAPQVYAGGTFPDLKPKAALDKSK